MAAARSSRILMASDTTYFLTFAAGMAAFWLSGRASALLPAMKNNGLAIASGLVVTGAVYGLGILVLSLVLLRHFGKGTLVSTGMAVVLGLASAQVIVRLAAGHIHNRTDVALLTFVLYLCYGLIYVISLAAGRRFAK